MHETIKKLSDQLNRILIGKEDKVFLVLTALLARGHVLLEDVPGVGKTTLATGLARSIDADYGRIQFTPDTLPGDITGVSVYRTNSGTFEYMPGVVMHTILLADEINRTAPKTQAALLEAMEEKAVTVDGVRYTLPSPFMVIATENPIDFLGTYNLPEAQLDRFLMRLSLGYPSKEEEARMSAEFLSKEKLIDIQPVIDCTTLKQLQEDAELVTVHPDLIGYVVDIIHSTRTTKDLSLGASPRATIAVLTAARAHAFLSGRDFVIPDDIRKILSPVLCHRLLLSSDARMRKASSEQILKELVLKIPVPILR